MKIIHANYKNSFKISTCKLKPMLKTILHTKNILLVDNIIIYHFNIMAIACNLMILIIASENWFDLFLLFFKHPAWANYYPIMAYALLYSSHVINDLWNFDVCSIANITNCYLLLNMASTLYSHTNLAIYANQMIIVSLSPLWLIKLKKSLKMWVFP